LAYTEKDLTELIKSNIEDIQHDPDLCSQYSNICSMARNQAYLEILAAKAMDLILHQGIADVFTALAQIENQLYTGEEA
jgi:hypothetical protein